MYLRSKHLFKQYKISKWERSAILEPLMSKRKLIFDVFLFFLLTFLFFYIESPATLNREASGRAEFLE